MRSVRCASSAQTPSMRPSRTGKNEKVTLEPSIQTFDTNHHSARVNASANRFLLPGASARVRRRSAWCPVPGVTEWGLSSAVAMPTRTADVICTTVVKASLHQASLHQGRWQDGAARAPRVWHRQGISIAIPCCHPLHEGLPQRGFHGNPGQRRGIAFEPHLNDGRCLPEGLRAGDSSRLSCPPPRP